MRFPARAAVRGNPGADAGEGAQRPGAVVRARKLDGLGLPTEAIDVWSTPRRLALIARGLPLETQAVSEEIKGPRTQAPPQALEGFLRKTGLTQEQLEERDGSSSRSVDRPGGRPARVLGRRDRADRRAPSPGPSRCAGATGRRRCAGCGRCTGLSRLLGEEIVPVEIDGIAARATTRRPSLPSSRADHHRRGARLCREAARLPCHRRP